MTQVQPVENYIDWYTRLRPNYLALTDTARSTLESLLQQHKIHYFGVTSRTKTIESFTKKLTLKRYEDPTKDISDLAGVRVITYIERDATAARDLIIKSFHVTNSWEISDKSTRLGVDKLGYRSIQFNCDLGGRVSFPEFSAFEGMEFEVQICTILQHAWAEIEHDRGYKFPGELSSKLKRRLRLQAGLLEVADRQFNSLEADIDDYAKDLDVAIDEGSLIKFLSQRLQESPSGREPGGPFHHVTVESVPNDILDEVADFGLITITDLSRLFTDEFLTVLDANLSGGHNSGAAVIRYAMMYADMDKYNSEVWKQRWYGIDVASHNILKAKYGDDTVSKVLAMYKIPIFIFYMPG